MFQVWSGDWKQTSECQTNMSKIRRVAFSERLHWLSSGWVLVELGCLNMSGHEDAEFFDLAADDDGVEVQDARVMALDSIQLVALRPRSVRYIKHHQTTTDQRLAKLGRKTGLLRRRANQAAFQLLSKGKRDCSKHARSVLCMNILCVYSCCMLSCFCLFCFHCNHTKFLRMSCVSHGPSATVQVPSLSS